MSVELVVPCSTEVEQLTHNPMIECSNRAKITGKEKNGEKNVC
jgi:hypothetical protein